jgi:hypothetical protein
MNECAWTVPSRSRDRLSSSGSFAHSGNGVVVLALVCRAVSAGLIEDNYAAMLRHHAVSLAYLGSID